MADIPPHSAGTPASPVGTRIVGSHHACRYQAPRLSLVIPAPNPSFVRKHVPDSDPGCALQSTSMPALHGRNVPNCRPMADGGMRKCSAAEYESRRLREARGLSPAGVGVGCGRIRCQFAVPNHNSGFSYLGVPAPAGMSDSYESPAFILLRGLPKAIGHSGEGRNPEGEGWGGTPYDRQQLAPPHLHLRDVASAKPVEFGEPAALPGSNTSKTAAQLASPCSGVR